MSQLRDDIEYTGDWVREPQGRGTLSILYTCTFTLVLCVYTAIHLNIPPAGEPRRWQAARKIKWMFIAMFAPEAVLFTAIHQFWSARIFCREMDRLRADLGGEAAFRKKPWWKRRPGCLKSHKEEDGTASAGVSTPQPPEPFSITYGFYVVMGGLTVDVSDMHNHIKTVTLSPFYVLETARTLKDWERFTVSDTTIQDKSKADTLAKTLVVLQVTWLFLQCIARASQAKPLTILEVHTLMHAVCAMLMYGFWFNKPLDIRDATVVDLPEFTDQRAQELMDLPGSVTPTFDTTGLRLSPQRRLSPRRPSFVRRMLFVLLGPNRRESLGLLPRLSESQVMDFGGSLLNRTHAESNLIEQDFEVLADKPAFWTAGGSESFVPDTTRKVPARQQGADYVCTLVPNSYLRCGWGLRFSIRHPSNTYGSLPNWDVISYSLTAKDVLRWKRAANKRLKTRPKEPPRGSIDLYPPLRILKSDTTTSTRSKNFDQLRFNARLRYDEASITYILGLAVITTVYGAIHLALWNFAFPSHNEMLLWKISGCAMAVLPLLLGGNVFVNGCAFDRDWLYHTMMFAFSYMGLLCLLVFIPLYIFARVFIVVESFLSLRMVPVGAYDGIDWVDYIPHL